MDTGATKSCMNYDTFTQLGLKLTEKGDVPTVVGADGSSLGAIGFTSCNIQMGMIPINQQFIVCTYLKRNIILGTDCAKQNFLGVKWTKEGTRILSVNGTEAIEIQETQLGTPVTAKENIKIPLFKVEAHGVLSGTQIVSPHPEFFRDYPTVYAHEISIKMDTEPIKKPTFAMHITNVSQDTNLYIKKNQVIGFAHTESEDVQYIETTTEATLDAIAEYQPRHWIPMSKEMKCHNKFIMWYNDIMEITDEIPSSCEQKEQHSVRNENRDEIPSRGTDSEWDNIQEVIDSDFLISPGDIYPNRKVELEDTQIKDITQTKFDQLCNKYDAAFSKNNRDIGTTQLIEMEIDTGDSPPIAQSPYTLPLKHYDWVKKEIETLEKAGVIIRSLSPRASPSL